MTTIIQNQTFDEERALYASHDLLCEDCTFAGPADGESACKECTNLTVRRCTFRLRYPFWHDHTLSVSDCTFTDTCRASFWYSDHCTLENCRMDGIKAFRECADLSFRNCEIRSPEFGWNCRRAAFTGGSIAGEYAFLGAEELQLRNLQFSGKYSFQYVKNAVITDCNLDTKDAFWHSDNVTVCDSVVRGEYLGWYSKNLHLIRCKIIGTQPLCYAENLVLEDCTMENCDLSFEYAGVEAEIRGSIDSVKNPASGHITADKIGEIIFDAHRKDTVCEVKERIPSL